MSQNSEEDYLNAKLSKILAGINDLSEAISFLAQEIARQKEDHNRFKKEVDAVKGRVENIKKSRKAGAIIRDVSKGRRVTWDRAYDIERDLYGI
jgi:uncharacterized coiled-coil DUF342 family protein